MNQNLTPLWTKIKNQIGRKKISFHTPGHKSGVGLPKELKAIDPWLVDLTEVPGLDCLSAPQGVIRESLDLVANLFQAKEAYFLVNGATAGNQAGIMSAFKPNDVVVVGRNAHISIFQGLVHSGADAVYINPLIDSNQNITLGINSSQIETVIEKFPVKGLVLVNPTYDGVIVDLKEIRTVSKDKVLMVDEAHGSHLPFCKELGFNSITAGADIVVQSWHKVHGSLTQTGILLKGTDRVCSEVLRSNLNLFQSTSPSYLFMASLDLVRQQLALGGQRRYAELSKWSLEVKENIKQIPGIRVLEKSFPFEEFDLDPLKISISLSDLGLSAKKTRLLLDEQYNITAEKSSEPWVLFSVGFGTSLNDLECLVAALKDMANRFKENTVNSFELNNVPEGSIESCSVPLLSPREAWLADKKRVTMGQALGRVAGEFITPYPPGIPVVIPGELITEEKLNSLKGYQETILVIA